MRIAAIPLSVLAFAALCFGGDASRSAAPELRLTVAEDEEHFTYSITHPELVSKAWIEVLDRPLLLDRKTVRVQASGELTWEWDRSVLGGWEQSEDALVISLWDPNGQTISCDANTVMTASPGGEVSETTVGGREKFYPPSILGSSLTRVEQDSPGVTFPVLGRNLTPSTQFHAYSEKEGIRCDDRFVRAEVQDLTHARLTIGGECLHKIGVFYISPVEDKNYAAWVSVASHRSPVLQSVSPEKVPVDIPQGKLALVLRGSGFTKDSKIYAGYLPTSGTYEPSPLILETEYVSPTELRAHVDPSYADDKLSERVSVIGSKLRIWVMGDEKIFELSEPRDVEFLLPPGQEWPRQIANITSVSPFPIRLMDEHSPEELMVTIRGERFVPENKVLLAAGHQSTNQGEVRYQYVSPTELRAWIPRQRWRKHRITYRLVVKTTSGQQYERRVNMKGNEQ